jgi:DNA modification methylase
VSVHVLRGDARRIPLRDNSVDLTVTSLPFFGLRDYGGMPGEIGAEAHWRDWLEAVVDATAEMARVTKPTGSIFVEVGDKRCNYQGPHYGQGRSLDGPRGPQRIPTGGPTDAPGRYGIPNKSLMLLPERYRIACVDQLGLTARQVIVWDKSNAIPNSAGDRTQDTHTTWVHLTMSRSYYSAWDELREPHVMRPQRRPNGRKPALTSPGVFAAQTYSTSVRDEVGVDGHPLGRMPGSVWKIPTEPFPKLAHLDAEHHAAFGVEWPRRLILAGSPPGICLECGQGRLPVVERRTDTSARPNGYIRARGVMDAADDGTRTNGSAFGAGPSVRGITEATILGYACSCTPATWHPGRGEKSPTAREDGRQGERPMSDLGARHERQRGWWEYHLDGWTPPPTRPAVVLDPFGGTGTTAHVAHALGRIGVSLDLSADYCRLAADRTLAAQRGAKVRGRVNRERQLKLFGGVG